jgi:hypothetical protein
VAHAVGRVSHFLSNLKEAKAEHAPLSKAQSKGSVELYPRRASRGAVAASSLARARPAPALLMPTGGWKQT